MKPNSAAETVQSHDAELKHAKQSAQSLLLICVKYGSDFETAQYLESLGKLQRHRNLQVVVVDNKGGAAFPEAPAELNLTFVQAEENLGYFGGARKGLSLYLHEHA